MAKQDNLFDLHQQTDNSPVVCLGIKFENEEARREYFREELRKKLPELKEIDGFPIGEDEDIIALSDPPYYTACPNPWINDFIEEWEMEKVLKYGRDVNAEYHREPFAADVSEGKNNPYYMVHSYHTKVPHKAIMKYLLHFTEPGDIILDGFSGSGMTGVAAQTLVSKEENYIDYLNNEVKMGERKAILSDLSPLATHITNNLNATGDSKDFITYFEQIIEKAKKRFLSLYQTNTPRGKRNINYIIWSEVLSCPSCQNDIVFWDNAVDLENKSVRDSFSCPNCGVEITKLKSNKSTITYYDKVIDEIVTTTKFIPRIISYKEGSSNKLKDVEKEDLAILEEVQNFLSKDIPTAIIPDGDEISRVKNEGFYYVHQLLPERTNLILTDILKEIKNGPYYNQSLFIITAALNNLNKLYRWRANGKGGVTSGTYYIPSTFQENNVFNQLERKLSDYKKIDFNNNKSRNLVSTNSATKSLITDNSIDYIFTDPPFGSNLMYSELNKIWETWISVSTNNKEEAIVNKKQQKNVTSYSELMTASFKEYYRVLKPNRWITIEFSNSKASIWNAIQEAIQKSGFVIANVAALDKKQGSFKAVTTTTAVKQDLVISAYKPRQEVIEKITSQINTEDSAWTFISQHLKQLPVFSGFKGEAQIISERTPRILFDRMVAYHVQNGLNVPISSSDFQKGLINRYPMRDGMAFLESQIAEYDKKRTLVKEFTQMSLFVSDENSAIEWIRQQLIKKPQTRQDLHPHYMKEIQHIAKHELLPELDDLLHQNFLRYEGDDDVPNQIAAYLRANYPNLRGLSENDSILIEKAMNRWYVPNPNKQADLEKLREKSLLREFDSYVVELENSKKKLKQFRTEAIRVGFKKAYSEKNFEKIVKIGDRLPASIIEEDDKLLMYYDNACIRLGL